MKVSYKKLWKMLIDKKMNRTDLVSRCHMSNSTLSKLSKDQPVRRDVLSRICIELDCDIEDIMDEIEDEENGDRNR